MAHPLLSTSLEMNVSLYQAAAAMNAHARWQEVIAENLAAGSIAGAPKQEVSFSAVEAGMASGATGLNGGRFVMPSTSTALSFSQGPLRPTGVQTDLGIEGPGFFEVQLPNGTHAFTRDGEFHLSPQGQFVTKQGYTLLSDGGPLQLDPNNSGPVSVAATGEVSQGGEMKGRLKLSEFSQPGLLKTIGGGYFLADNPQLQASPAQVSQLRQGFLESANISPTSEMASLMTSMRMFEANQKVMQMQDERMGKVITDLSGTSS